MKVAIAGYGAEGRNSYDYYATQGHDVTILDERVTLELPEGIKARLGEGAFDALADFDMVVRSPGISPKKLTGAKRVWSQTREFFSRCEAPIIGVTGTKGKGTTSSLIASMLRAADKSVHLIGNIGVPALEVLATVKPEDIVVFELSSFQLCDVEQSPQVAVVLGIEPDHLDVHDSFEEYVDAKARITEYQMTTDRVIYNASNEPATSIAKRSVGQLLPYPSNRTAHIRGEYFYYQDEMLCEIDQLQLPGTHNAENACAAITAVWSWVQDANVIAEGLRSFDGLPHRLKFVREVAGVRYYDDSIATTPGSAIAAIRAFDGPKTIILGGSDKGASYRQIIELCRDTGTVVIAVGQTGRGIHDLCTELGVTCERVEGGMGDVVRAASRVTPSGGVVMLSPASASFDQYRSYVDRGNQFIAAVESLTEANG